ncbi:hypothetical protein COOONC_24482 [Cooperia oncophora]
MGDASILMKLLGFLWMNIGIALIAITLQQPAQTQLQMNKTAELLLGYDFCQNSVDDQVLFIAPNIGALMVLIKNMGIA